MLSLPSSSFQLIVPALILIACVLVLVQPWLSRADRRPARPPGRPDAPADGSQERTGPVLGAGVFASAAYGGYFGAAQGVLVIGLLGTFLDESMQRVNGAKNVLVAVVNGTAAIVYIIFAHVAWLVVLLIAVGSTIGGLLGARFGRRLPAPGAADLRRRDRCHFRGQADLLLISRLYRIQPQQRRPQPPGPPHLPRGRAGRPRQPSPRRAGQLTANATRSDEISATPPITLGAAMPAP